MSYELILCEQERFEFCEEAPLSDVQDAIRNHYYVDS